MVGEQHPGGLTGGICSTSRLKADLIWGIRAGLGYALGFSLLALLIVVLFGRDYPSDVVRGVWLLGCLLYGLLGVVFGAVVGLVRPAIRGFWASVTLGATLGAVASGIGLAVLSRQVPPVGSLAFMMAGGGLLGGGMGAILRGRT